MTQPNILYIHSHDTGRYVSPYGYALDTPRIQQLAEEGVLFRQAFCAAPTCSPSRAALLTGCAPHVNGMVGLAHRGSRLRDYSQHLARVLSANGYRTALSGMQHEASWEGRGLLGYQDILDDLPFPEIADKQEAIARRAAAYLAQSGREPFFLSCGFFATHRTPGQGFQDNGEFVGDSRYCRPPAPLPDTPATRRDFADFSVAAHRLDSYMGIVFDALEANGLAENTLVVCTTDHGIAFPFMKCNLTDHGTGVMLILRGPGGFTGGTVVDAMVSHMDLFPTICDLAGISAPSWLEGASLTPLVDGTAETLHEELFSEVSYHAAAEPMRAVRTTRYKYIRRFHAEHTPILANCDGGVSKRELLDNGNWRERTLPAEYLFDLLYDPNEACNLATDMEHAGILADMQQRLTGWMLRTDDPLLSGNVPIWPELTLNRTGDDAPEDPQYPAADLLMPPVSFWEGAE